ncbi:hypothetical protein IG631_13037 [Alternaria alternata]|nr:hypothetical protein IG631_13037 [Alternaria alternata]
MSRLYCHQCNSRVRPQSPILANNAEPRCPTGVIPTVCFDDDVWSGAADDPNPVEFGVRRKTHYTIARGYQGAVMSLVAFTPHQHCPPPAAHSSHPS